MAQVCFKALRAVCCADGASRVKAIGNVSVDGEHGECVSMFVSDTNAIAWLEAHINEWPLFDCGELVDEQVGDVVYRRVKEGAALKRIGWGRETTTWEF